MSCNSVGVVDAIIDSVGSDCEKDEHLKIVEDELLLSQLFVDGIDLTADEEMVGECAPLLFYLDDLGMDGSFLPWRRSI